MKPKIRDNPIIHLQVRSGSGPGKSIVVKLFPLCRKSWKCPLVSMYTPTIWPLLLIPRALVSAAPRDINAGEAAPI